MGTNSDNPNNPNNPNPDFSQITLTQEEASYIISVARHVQMALVRAVSVGAKVCHAEIHDASDGDKVKSAVMIGLTPRAAQLMDEAAVRITAQLLEEDELESLEPIHTETIQ